MDQLSSIKLDLQQKVSSTTRVYYDETYSAIIKPTMTRTMLYIKIYDGQSIHQIVIHNAFLHGHLFEEVFITQPWGYQHPQFPNHVCKLHKTIYDLKQVSRAWFSWLSSRLLELGFHGSKLDTSLFICHNCSLTIYVLIYVDNIIITNSSPMTTDTLLSTLQSDLL